MAVFVDVLAPGYAGSRDFLGRWKSIWKILYEEERSVASFFAVTKLEKYE